MTHDDMAAAYNTIEYWTEGPVARIRLNRPEKSNAMSAELLSELDAALARIADDEDVRVTLLDGAGAGFCAGYDITPGGSTDKSKGNIVADWLRLKGNIQRWVRLYKHPKPIIAKIHNYAVAGGFELAMACDLVVASDDCRLGYPAVRSVGTPPFMIFPLLAQMRVVKRMLYTGDTVSGAAAVALGFVNEAVPAAELEGTASKLARRVALMPLDQLLLLKSSVVRAYEILGLDAIAMSGVEFDAVSHFGPVVQEFWKVTREEGLKVAVERRDAPFREAEG
ncbi:MAG: enoyl-CoA hydratase-related protein [Thermoleophilia bacterium]|nr:enoyl-CoA hydratase-related protein [Thermoleophilia bacterium]